MPQIGDKVRVLWPFDEAYPEVYTVAIVDVQDTYVMLEGVESAFAWHFVEAYHGD